MKNDIIGIIGAMDIEVDGIISSMSQKSEKTISGIKYVCGKIYEKEVVVAKCGVGKVFAAICAQTMIIEYSPKVIINTGVAGSLVSGFNVLDVAIAKSVVQHDMDTSALGDPKGLISGINVVYMETDEDVINALKIASGTVNCNVKMGVIASGDKFVSDNNEKIQINKTFDAIACEMEGASIGQTCYINGVPFGVLRAISDGDGAEMDYMTFAPKAAEQSVKIIMEFIKIFE